MEWKKVKWLIITLLLAVNIFLGINIAIRYTTSINHEKNDLKTALSLAPRDAGFSMDKFEKLPRYLYSFYGKRDLTAEIKLAKLLMGENSNTEKMGGGVYLYSLVTKERLIFRRGGAIEGIIPSPKKTPESLFNGFFEAEDVTFERKDQVYSFSYDEVEISNASLSYITAGNYMSVTGILPLSQSWEKAEKSRSRSEMVMALSQAVSDNEMGNLISVKVVYFLESNGVSDLRLTPAWLAECDKGNITVSMSDKSVLAVEKTAVHFD